MMKKIFGIAICMLMVVSVLPAIGFPIQTGEIENSNNSQIYYKPPTPGYAPIPPSDTFTDVSIVHEPLDITAATIDDIVIGMIEEVDESVYLNYLEDLVGFGPRRTGTSSCIAAATYIYDQFESFGLEVRYHHWVYGGYDSNNVEATINGINETSDEIYIICGHYDTVTSSPGADDDASGTVAVIIAAYIMSQYQFEHDIKFVAFSGEEQGLLGSAVYASEAANQGWNIVGVLNADMISYAITTYDGNNLIVFENTASEWLYTYTLGINTEYYDYIHLTLTHGGYTWGSDHNSFWDEGYDALFYFEKTETPYYHSSDDTIDHINATYAVKNIRLILATLAELAEASIPSNAPYVPTLSGPLHVVINESGTFTVLTTDPDNDNIYYYIDWGDGTNTGWFGPYPSGTSNQSSHKWTSFGNFSVKAKAKDIYGVQSGWSEPLIVIVSDNLPPGAPTIAGKTSGKVGVTYQYEFSSTDPNGNDVYFFIFWGDGTDTDWIGPYNSSEVATISHAWSEKGTYIISARAKDVGGYESDWSQLKVKMPRAKIANNSLLYHLFQQLQLLQTRLANLFN